MQVTLDPTSRDIVRLSIDREGTLSEMQWAATDDPAGARLIQELRQLSLARGDELRVIVGPGHFTGIRVAALVGNALAYTHGVRLFQKTLDDTEWQVVDRLVPYYTSAPIIHPARV